MSDVLSHLPFKLWCLKEEEEEESVLLVCLNDVFVAVQAPLCFFRF